MLISTVNGCAVTDASDAPFEQHITFNTLDRYCQTNTEKFVSTDGDKIQGIVIQFHSIGETGTTGENQLRLMCNRYNVLYVFPFGGPWNWMNTTTVRLSDRIIDVLIEYYGLDKDIPVVATGASMGGHGALVYPVYSRHNIVGVAANCPVTDVWAQGEYDEMMQRTFLHAVGDYEGSYLAALDSISPIKLVDKMPDIPYYIVHGGADADVPPDINSRAFVSKMQEKGFDITYTEVEGMTHVLLSGTETTKFRDFIFTTLGAK